MPLVDQKSDESHLDAALQHYRKARRDLEALAESGPSSSIIHPQYVMRLVSKLASDDAIFTCDVGTPIVWTARYLKVNGKRRIIGSFNHGSMANAHAAGDGRPGGLSRATGDLDVRRWRLHHDDGRVHHPRRRLKLPVKIIVLNNGTLGFVEMENEGQRLSRHRLRAARTRTSPPWPRRWASRASASRSRRIWRPRSPRRSRHDGPALVDVVSARQELAMPPKTTADEAYHFGMFMMKAVLDGRATELIDLAKVNLLPR